METVAFMTLGCKVNQYDTQAMLEGFLKRGYRVVSFEDICDVYVVNTCTVTGTGDQKSKKTIRQAARRNPQAAIVAAGCLGQREGRELAKLPGVRLVLGTSRRAEAAELLDEALRRGTVLNAVDTLENAAYEETAVTVNEGRTRAILKIQDGCDRRCAYCIIPQVRGPVRSRPLDAVREEAARLAAAGFREVVLTGIHLCSYGRDIGEIDLRDAVRACAEHFGRVRLGSLEPTYITPDVARELAGIEALCGQFHLSLQSGADRVLRLMRRGYTARRYREAVDALRAAMPGCAITTDVITGFPGETEEAFAQTEAFCAETAFSRMHVFPYSERTGTPAAAFEDAVPPDVRRTRARRLIELGTRLEAEYMDSFIGKRCEVLFEEAGEGLSREYLRVHAQGGLPNETAAVTITGREGNVLRGEIV